MNIICGLMIGLLIFPNQLQNESENQQDKFTLKQKASLPFDITDANQAKLGQLGISNPGEKTNVQKLDTVSSIQGNPVDANQGMLKKSDLAISSEKKSKRVTLNKEYKIKVSNDWDPKKPGNFVQVSEEFLKRTPDAQGTVFLPVRLGETDVKVFKNGIPVLEEQILIIPDEKFLSDFVKQQFPMSELKVQIPVSDMVVVNGYVPGPEDEEKIKELISLFHFDKSRITMNIRVAGPTQIQLQVVIARVDRNELRRLGFDFLLDVNKNVIGTKTSAFDPLNRANPEKALSGAFFGINGETVKLYSLIDTLRRNNVAKIMANPTLVTYNGRQADFLVGGQVPIPVTGSITAPTIQYKDFGTRLSFIPALVQDGKIRIEVTPEVSTLDENTSTVVSGVKAFNFKVQRLHATVEMSHGESLFLGGLIETSMEGESNNLLFAGGLPVIGTFFRNNRSKLTEKELLILVTPRLVQPFDCDPSTVRFPGQGTTSPSSKEFVIEGATESALRPGKEPKHVRQQMLSEDFKLPSFPINPVRPPDIDGLAPSQPESLSAPRSINPVSWFRGPPTGPGKIHASNNNKIHASNNK